MNNPVIPKAAIGVLTPDVTIAIPEASNNITKNNFFLIYKKRNIKKRPKAKAYF